MQTLALRVEQVQSSLQDQAHHMDHPAQLLTTLHGSPELYVVFSHFAFVEEEWRLVLALPF